MNNNYDVIIIGGGPSGMIAAGTAGSLGKKVLLLEKNSSLGKKLLISGGGRCNLTNTTIDLRKSYFESGKYLYSTFSQFDVEKTLEFFHINGMKTKVEEKGRVFPITNNSKSVLDVLVNYMKEGNVEIRFDTSVKKIEKKNEEFKIYISNDEIITSSSCVIATGGTSHPETGSTGEGFTWLESLGHKTYKSEASLVPLCLKDNWAKELSGISIKDIKMDVYSNEKKTFNTNGDLLFTHFGISGPMILDISTRVGRLLKEGSVTILVDIFPQMNSETLRTNLNEMLESEKNKMLRNTLGKLIPSKLAIAILNIANINIDISNNKIRKEDRLKVIQLLKALPLNVEKLMGIDKAIVSSGGVDINEIEFKTMESKIIKGLYLVGDVLNIDRPSGGYSLQLCWSTGYVAGSNC